MKAFLLRHVGGYPPEFGYTYLVIYGTAAFTSAIVSIALVIPLFLQLWKKRGPNGKGAQTKRSRTKRGKGGEASYSTYNLYLVYIALTDLFISLTRFPQAVAIVLDKGYFGYDDSLDLPYMFAYFTANFSINAIVCYQVWVLLQSTQQGKRIHPPSLTRVNLQSLLAYFLAVVIAVTIFYVRQILFYDYVWYYVWLSILALPAMYIFGVSGLVWYRGYLRTKKTGTTSVNDKGTRVLALFFFRIVWIFIIFFLPGGVVVPVFNNLLDGFESITTFIFYVLFGLQPIVTACCVLTKPDCKRYIVDLVTLSYLFGDTKCCGFCGKDTAGSQTTSKTAKGLSVEPLKPTSIRNGGNANEVSTERDTDSSKENEKRSEDSALKPNDVSAWDAASSKQRMLPMEDHDDFNEDDEEIDDPTKDDALTSAADADPETGAYIYNSKQENQNRKMTVSKAGETVTL